MTTEAVEAYWSRTLQRDIEIVPKGWADDPGEYDLIMDGTFIVSYKRIAEIEDYLSRYFLGIEAEEIE